MYNEALPVVLMRFEGNILENNVRLNWKIASTENVEMFQVQHSMNGKSWDRVGTVQYRESQQVYRLVHENPRYGLNYYRLKVTDLDQTFEYSPIISVDLRGSGRALRIVPNPAVNHITAVNHISLQWQGSENTRKIMIYNTIGLLVKEQSVSRNSPIDLSGFNPGVYLVVAEDSFGQKHTSRVVKQ